jgi:hypothetical protein
MGCTMSAGAQLNVTDLRRAARHPSDYTVIADHRLRGDVHLNIVNVSSQGFMATGIEGLDRGT